MTGKMKWLLLLLAVSAAINVFALGLLLGKQFRPEGRPGDPREHVEFNLRRLAAYLPEDKQREVRTILRDHRRSMRDHFAEMRAKEARIRELISAETVDIEALEQALGDHEAKKSELRAPVRTILLDVVAHLDQKTRQALAEDLFKRRRTILPREDRMDEGHRLPPPPEGEFGDEWAREQQDEPGT